MSENPPLPIIDRGWSATRQWQISAIAALAIAGLLVGIWAIGKFRTAAPAVTLARPTPPGTFRATPQQLKTFTVEEVQLHPFVSEELTEGKIGIDSDKATPVVSPYSGRITRVIAGIGDRVSAGAPLATLDATEFVQAQNDLKLAATQLQLAKSNETRKHALYDAKGGSLQDWQQAQADLMAAETGLNSVRNRFRILGRSVADVVRLEHAQSIDPVATLTAPIAGVVVDRQVGPGQYLQAGGAPVFTIADPSLVWLLANVREVDASLVHIGQAVEVRVPAYPKRIFKARITYVAAVVDPVTHRLPVRAEIENHDGALKPEMFANFRILTSGASAAPGIPESAIVYEGEAAHVWVLAADGLLTLRAIRAGRTNDGLVEVLDGLQAGEHVVTRGALFIDQEAVPAST